MRERGKEDKREGGREGERGREERRGGQEERDAGGRGELEPGL